MGGFADRMREYMEEKNWNQPEFTQFLGVTKQDIIGVRIPYAPPPETPETVRSRAFYILG